MEAALEQYLILAKTAKGKACESLIFQAISNPKTFVFGELLDAVREGGVSKESQKILEIFTYDTLQDYRKARLPDLTSQQLKKIQMLSLVSYASQKAVLMYKDLQSLLEIGSTRQLEDLIIDTIYEGLIKGKIDHKNSCLRVFQSIGRDIRPEEIPSALQKIKNYINQITQIEATANENISYSQSFKTISLIKKEKFDEDFKENKAIVRATLESTTESQGILSRMKKQFSIGHK